jgi:hypothetical protein
MTDIIAHPPISGPTGPPEFPSGMLPPSPPPAAKPSRKKWMIGGGVLVALGIFGAVTNHPGTSKAEVSRIVNNSLSSSVDSNGDLDEVAMIRKTCGASLDFRDDGQTRTYRQKLAAGDISTYQLADVFAKAYLGENNLSHLSRADVIRVCTSGLNSY